MLDSEDEDSDMEVDVDDVGVATKGVATVNGGGSVRGGASGGR